MKTASLATNVHSPASKPAAATATVRGLTPGESEIAYRNTGGCGRVPVVEIAPSALLAPVQHAPRVPSIRYDKRLGRALCACGAAWFGAWSVIEPRTRLHRCQGVRP